MHDPFSWSIPFGRLFGITIRIHILFPIVALALVARVAVDDKAPPGASMDAVLIVSFLFFSVLLHEFGHCFAARAVNGDAQEVLLWPLGGLAAVDVPHTPRANLITAAAGPAVNLVLALACMLLLWLTASAVPHFGLKYIGREFNGLVYLSAWGGGKLEFTPYALPVLLNHFFWVNYLGFLLNVVLIGFPLDGGRIFQSIAWKYVGYRRATLAAVYVGFVVMFIVGLYSIIDKDPLPLCLAIFIYVSCKQQWIILETGGEESLFGYDFSQGYTSLERDEVPTAPPRRRQSWWQRWLERRATRKAQRAEETRLSDERRLDELLEKVQREGITALTDEERRFMKRVSDRYRNRPSP